MPHPHFTHHVFVCTNQRPDGAVRECCAAKGSLELRNYMKQRARELGLKGVRINTSGCLDQCEAGPTVVVYPEGTWYTLRSKEEVDRVLAEHLGEGKVVEQLTI